MTVVLDSFDGVKPVEYCRLFCGPYAKRVVQCDIRRDIIKLAPPFDHEKIITRDSPSIHDTIEMLVYKRIRLVIDRREKTAYVLESEYDNFIMEYLKDENTRTD